ncbi:tyrosine-type recombinase/integrase [Acidiphilium acidophilum]|nr:site-specific integrase [Acidiphilium acidophilum]
MMPRIGETEMKSRITDTAITAAVRKATETGQRIEIADAALRGLRLRVTPTGSKVWILGARDAAGAPRRFTIGHHPAIGIADARDAARKLRERVREGFDPIDDARQRRAEAEAARENVNTLSDLIAHYGAKQGGKLKSWPEYQGAIRRVFGPLLPMPLSRVTIGSLQMAADRYQAQQQAASAVRCIRPLLKWASAPGRKYVTADLADIRVPATIVKRDRVLTDDELRRILPVLRADNRPFAACMRFLLLTCARRDEAAYAKWGDIDFRAATWLIQDTKNKRPHLVPLSRQAIDLVASIRPDDVAADALIFATCTGKPLGNWDKSTKQLFTATGTTGWTRHDLRRTAATKMGKLGVAPHVIESALNHASVHSPLASVYNTARYEADVAKALQLLADALDGIEQGGAQIVPMRA